MIRERGLPQSAGGGTAALRFGVASVPGAVRGADTLPARRSAGDAHGERTAGHRSTPARNTAERRGTMPAGRDGLRAKSERESTVMEQSGRPPAHLQPGARPDHRHGDPRSRGRRGLRPDHPDARWPGPGGTGGPRRRGL